MENLLERPGAEVQAEDCGTWAKVAQTLRPGARAASGAAAAGTQLSRLRAKLRPGAGTGDVS